MIGDRGPGCFAARCDRADRLRSSRTAGEPLALLRRALRHQQERAAAATVVAAAALLARDAERRRAAERWPLLDLHAATDVVAAEVRILAAVAMAWSPPSPLAQTLSALTALPDADLRSGVDLWLDDPSAVDPRLSTWLRVASGPVLETAAAQVGSDLVAGWHGPACPWCGGPPQVSVIDEGTGEFLGGAPRWLVCARCAGWWRFPRATCFACGEQRPTALTDYVAEGLGWVRVDACATCRSYLKTFDLRQDGAAGIAPLVDDLASIVLDVWAAERGLRRPAVSLAGV